MAVSESLNYLKIVTWCILLCIEKEVLRYNAFQRLAFFFSQMCSRSAYTGYKLSLIVPAWFSKTKMFRCFRDLESIYHAQYLPPEDMIYYHATYSKLVLPGNSL